MSTQNVHARPPFPTAVTNSSGRLTQLPASRSVWSGYSNNNSGYINCYNPLITEPPFVAPCAIPPTITSVPMLDKNCESSHCICNNREISGSESNLRENKNSYIKTAAFLDNAPQLINEVWQSVSSFAEEAWASIFNKPKTQATAQEKKKSNALVIKRPVASSAAKPPNVAKIPNTKTSGKCWQIAPPLGPTEYKRETSINKPPRPIQVPRLDLSVLKPSNRPPDSTSSASNSNASVSNASTSSASISNASTSSASTSSASISSALHQCNPPISIAPLLI